MGEAGGSGGLLDGRGARRRGRAAPFGPARERPQGRRAGDGGQTPRQRRETPVHPRGREAGRREGALPRQAAVGDGPAGEAELGGGGEHQPGPAGARPGDGAACSGRRTRGVTQRRVCFRNGRSAPDRLSGRTPATGRPGPRGRGGRGSGPGAGCHHSQTASGVRRRPGRRRPPGAPPSRGRAAGGPVLPDDPRPHGAPHGGVEARPGPPRHLAVGLVGGVQLGGRLGPGGRVVTDELGPVPLRAAPRVRRGAGGGEPEVAVAAQPDEQSDGGAGQGVGEAGRRRRPRRRGPGGPPSVGPPAARPAASIPATPFRPGARTGPECDPAPRLWRSRSPMQSIPPSPPRQDRQRRPLAPGTRRCAGVRSATSRYEPQ